jgi:hypothetical protein
MHSFAHDLPANAGKKKARLHFFADRLDRDPSLA